MKTEILKVGISEGFEDNTTVFVKTRDNTFRVQMTDGEFRGDLGCWITTDKSEGEDIDSDQYEEDIDLVIEAAEKYMNELTEIHETDLEYEGSKVLVREISGSFEVLIKNPQFINSATSSYQTEYFSVGTGESMEAILKGEWNENEKEVLSNFIVTI